MFFTNEVIVPPFTSFGQLCLALGLVASGAAFTYSAFVVILALNNMQITHHGRWLAVSVGSSVGLLLAGAVLS